MEPEGSLPHLQVPCHCDMACPQVCEWRNDLHWGG